MRFKVVFKSKNKKLPIGYRTLFSSLFKSILEKSDKEYFKEVYFYEEKKNKKIKNLNFSVYLQNFKIGSNEIEVDGDIILNITTPDFRMGLDLYNGLVKLKQFTFKKKYELNKISLTKVKESVIKDKLNVFKTLSPIYIKDKYNNDLDINDENFNKELNYISDKYLKEFRGFGLKEELNFTPIKMKKQICKEEIEDFTRITGKKYLLVKCYSGIFSLEGDQEDVEILLKSGLGFRRSFGFSMISIV